MNIRLVVISCLILSEISLFASLRRTDSLGHMLRQDPPKSLSRKSVSFAAVEPQSVGRSYEDYVTLCARFYQQPIEAVGPLINHIWPAQHSASSVPLNMASQAGNLEEVRDIVRTDAKLNIEMLKVAQAFALGQHQYFLCDNFQPIGDCSEVGKYLGLEIQKLENR